MRARKKYGLARTAYALELPLGALEEIAEVNPRIYEIYIAMHSAAWELRELTAVLRAGLNAAGHEGLEVGEVIEGLGVQPSLELARETLKLAIHDEKGALEAGKPTAGKSTSPSAST